ncbi:MAG TPA: 3-oxoacyl-ACP reductase [Polyangiales bacterium]
MSDFLLDLSRNPTAKKLIQAAGLPLPLPTPLERPKGPTSEQVLRDQLVHVAGDGQLSDALAQLLVIAGANPVVVGDQLAAAFAKPGETYNRRARKIAIDTVPEGEKINALVFDATGLEKPEDLKQIYSFFQPRMRSLARCARALIIVRPFEQAKTVEQSAARHAVEGFTRSLGKEIGKFGATSNLIVVEDGAEARVAPVARFILSSASAFVTGQPLRVTNRAKGEVPTEYARPLAGKVVLVTGAARGIGAATAEILASEGAKVVILDRPADGEPAAETAKKIGGTVLLADVSDKAAPAQIAEFLKAKFGGVDVLVHNAGITRDKMLANMKPEVWDQTIEINLSAVLRITTHLIDEGLLRDGGRVIGLSSIAGIAGNNGQTNYSTSKSGIIGWVSALAPKLAERGITANAIAPGFIETRMTAAVPVAIREVGRRLASLGQGGQPSDVGQAITFLATPGSLGVTGQVLRVCGGAFLGK